MTDTPQPSHPAAEDSSAAIQRKPWLAQTLRLHPAPKADLIVYVDETCGICKRTAVWLDRLNWFRRVRLVGANEHPTFAGQQYIELKSTRSDGAEFGGYFSCRQIAWRLPLLWWMIPLLYLPGVPRLGVRLHRRIAESRTCSASLP